jgi:Pyruvate/2-oxoacid:ferredoxin oxidoreductase delta subunit
MPKPKRIVYCHCAHTDLVPAAAREAVLSEIRTRCGEGLAGAALEFEAVADLCELAARRDPAMKRLAEGGALTIVACYPRAVRWLFAAAGAPLPEKGTKVLNLRADGPEKVLRALAPTGRSRRKSAKAGGRAAAHALSADLEAAARAAEWIPWFPVIDYSRCKNCKQCLNFCLFGTYALSAAGKVEVRHPDHCKTNCPACARVCPELAIIFPKHRGAPIDGAEVQATDLKRGDVRVGLKARSREDIYAALRGRSRLLGARKDGR